MSSQDKNPQYVKKEMMLMIALITFVAGFLGGIIFSAFNSNSAAPVRQASVPAQQGMPGQPPDMNAEQARRILTLEKEVSVSPQNADAWANLGHLYFDTNKPQKAINAYNKSLAIAPVNPDVLTDLGVMYRRNKQFDEALGAFKKAVEQSPRHEQARFNQGIVLMYDKGDKEGAIKIWEELLSINPNATAPNGQSMKQMIESVKKEG